MRQARLNGKAPAPPPPYLGAPVRSFPPVGCTPVHDRRRLGASGGPARKLSAALDMRALFCAP